MNENAGMVKKWEPNIVPLCDILLIIMIIFMVISPIFSRSIDIYLPGDEPVCTLGTGLVIMEKDTSITFNRKPASIETLPGILSDYFGNRRPRTTVYVSADKNIAYKHILKLVDVLKAAGITDVVLWD